LGHASSAYRPTVFGRLLSEAGKLKHCPALNQQNSSVSFLCVLQNVWQLVCEAGTLKGYPTLF
ncbi:hypothetical protein ACQP3J_31580, partial [Escherichia coli]